MDPDPATVAESSAPAWPHEAPPSSDVANEPLHKQSLWKEWDAFVEPKSNTGFMQSSWWVDFRSTCDFGNFGIVLRSGNEIVGGAVVLRFMHQTDRCFYYIQDGPVLPSDSSLDEPVFQAVLSEIEQRRRNEPCTVSHLRMEPRWKTVPDFVQGFRFVRPCTDHFLEARDTRCVDLRLCEPAILAQMKPKGRYNIGVARRHGVSVVQDTSAQGLADFQRIYEETCERQGMAPKPPDYFETLVSLFSPLHKGSLFFAEYRGVRLAAALVIYFGPRATYFYGGSGDIHREVMAPYLLHFEVMREAKRLGHEWYDFWGIAPENKPDHPWRNFSVFKAKFGGVEEHLVRTMDFVFDEAAYEEYKKADGVARNGTGQT
jgi:lipid II:glycine glycyltransferase (peptidoglycan interpeptide bridge formation enzyme)